MGTGSQGTQWKYVTPPSVHPSIHLAVQKGRQREEEGKKNFVLTHLSHLAELEYKKIPVPKPGPDEVLVQIKYSGVCHTDLHAINGDWPLPSKLPLVGGHEGAGVVVARGELAKNVEIGDHVGIKWLNGSCMNCTYCFTANEVWSLPIVCSHLAGKMKCSGQLSCCGILTKLTPAPLPEPRLIRLYGRR